MVEYLLPSHVYFSCRGEALVFLDLKQDEYVLVNGDAAAAIQVLSSQTQTDERNQGLAGALEELLESGLLTTDRNAGKDIAATKTELALEHLVEPEVQLAAHITLSHVWRFTVACTTAALRLSWQRFEDIVATTNSRKIRRTTSQPLDLARARELTAVFQRLRYFFPMNYLCLYDSLSLLEFLAQYRIFPSWIFGIRLEPWAAHCWVQEAGFVFNEDVEEAAKYTAVMAI